MHATAQSQTMSILTVLEQTPIILEKILAAATEDEMQWKPAAERWSISEVLSHLADVEVAGFRERVKLMLDEENPQLPKYDQIASYAAGKYTGGHARDHMKRFCHERDRSLSWLRYVPVGMGTRSGVHVELGPVTVSHLMHEWAFHDLGHIRQIAELYRSCVFYPEMGPYRNYYTIRP